MRRLLVGFQVFLLVATLFAPLPVAAVDPSPSPDPSASAPADPPPDPTPVATPDPTPVSTPDPTPDPTVAADPTVAPDPTPAPVADPTTAPAADPSTAPDPSVAPSTDPSVAPSADPSTPAPDPTTAPISEPSTAPVYHPTIASDLADYPPGGLVTLTGTGWQPGESVHIFVNDDWGSSWSRNVDVAADGAGQIDDSFNLPNWFVAHYSVIATGRTSGVATTAFTDGTVRVKTVGAGGTAAGVTWVRFNTTNCTGSPVDSGSIVAATANNGTDIPVAVTSSQSLRLTAGSVAGFTFSSWSGGAFNPTNAAVTCLSGTTPTQNTSVIYSPNSANAAPVADDETISTSEDTTVDTSVGTLLTGDTDVDSATLTITAVSSATGGVATLNNNGTPGTTADDFVRFTPLADVCGVGAGGYDYTVSDGSLTDTGHVTVDITCVNDAPSFTKGADQMVDEDASAQSITTWATAISKGPSNESGQTVDFIVNNNNNALFSAQPAISATGTLTYTPAANANGSATVTVQIHDNGGTANGGVDTSASQTFTITVNPVNDAPVVSLSSSNDLSANEGSNHTYGFTVTDVDNGDTFSVVSESCGAKGTLGSTSTTASGGSFDCTFPDGPDSSIVSVQVKDSDNANSNTDTQTVGILNVAPTVTTASIVINAITGEITSSLTYFDPGNDTETATFEYRLNGSVVATQSSASGLPASGSVSNVYRASPGCYVVEVTMSVTDSDGTNSASFVQASGANTDIYSARFEAPIKSDERNIAKYGNVVPIKVTLASSCNPGTTTTVPTLHLTIAPGNVADIDPDPTPVIVAESVSSADTGTQMRVNGGGYIYNFSTKVLTAGQDYTIRVRVGSTTGTIIARALFQPKK